MATGDTTGTLITEASGGGPRLSFWQFITRVGDFMGIGRSPKDDALDRVIERIEDGYQRFLMCEIPVDPRFMEKTPHQWSFLAPQSTLAITDETWEYDAPADFACFVSKPTHAADVTAVKKALDIVSELEIRNMRAAYNREGDPEFIAVVAKDFASRSGQTFGFKVFPTPNADRTLYYRYAVQQGAFATAVCEDDGNATWDTTTAAYDSISDTDATFSTDGVEAGDKVVVANTVGDQGGIYTISSVESETKIKLTSTVSDAGSLTYKVYDDAIYALGGGVHSQTLLEIILALVEERDNDGVGVHAQTAQRLLASSVARDRMLAPHTIGQRTGIWSPRVPPVTYV